MDDKHSANIKDFHLHSQIWVPEDLQAGDIIRCKMLTLHSELEKAEMCPRNVMVLGFEMDPESLEYTSIHVSRFSYTPMHCTDSTNFLIPRYMERKGLVQGLDTPLVMTTDHTDFIPLTFDHFNDRITRVGNVSLELFKDIKESMEEGHNNAPNSRPRYPKKENKDWYIAGAHMVGEDITSPHHQYEYSDLSDIDRARIQMDTIMKKDPYKLDGAYVTQCILDFEKACKKYQYQLYLESKNRKKESRFSDEDSRKARAQDTQDRKSNVNHNTPETTKTPISPEERFMMSIPRMDTEKLASLQELAEKFNTKAPANFNITLPKHLWQGRYLMLRIPSLVDKDCDGDAYRPCAVWKAYADKETGDLAGLELHPVTRGSANRSTYKFQVYPVKTGSKNPSYLLADCVVRVPLDEKYFHESTTSNFYELPPSKLEKFKAKRDIAMDKCEPHIVGLQEVPENWVEIDMDPVPSFQQFIKWVEKGQISFDGAINEDKKTKQRRHKHKKSTQKPQL